MNKISRFTYTILVMTVTAGLMTGGFLIGFNQSATEKFNTETKNVANVNNTEKEETVKTDSKNLKEIEENNEKESSNEETSKQKEEDKKDCLEEIEVTYLDHYKKCGHTVKSKVTIFGVFIENLKKNIAEDTNTKGYKLTEETENKLVYTKEYDQYCPEHFYIKIEEGKIVIYNLASEGIKVEYQTLETPVEKLKDELKEKLEKGISVDSKDDLYDLIEDIQS